MEKTDLHIGYTHNWFDHPLTILLKIDDRVINYDVSGKAHVEINKTIKLVPGKHLLTLEISNKTENQTTIDAHGKILDNTVVILNKFSVNGIDFMPMSTTHSDFGAKFFINNKNDQVINAITEFGFNGTWNFEFETPLYDWLLEKMF